MAEELKIWCLLKSEGFNDYAVAGIMGNLYAESHLNPQNLEDTANLAKGISDEEYTSRVDNGTYKNFSNDQVGYGIAQWTYSTRKKKLLEYAKSLSTSIGDLPMQVKFLVKELKEEYEFRIVYDTLKKATSVQEASNIFLLKFERPRNSGTSVQNYRTSLGLNYYMKYKGISEFSGDTSSKPLDTSVSQKFIELRLPVIKYGSRGTTVKSLQILLSGNNCPCGNPDGISGRLTVEGIQNYQDLKGLDVDGEAGVQTFSSLLT